MGEKYGVYWKGELVEGGFDDILINRLPERFDKVSIYYDSSMGPETLSGRRAKPYEKKVTVIKVFCPEAKFKLKPSEAGQFYRKLCDEYVDLASKSLANNKFVLVGYQFDLVFEMYPPEDPNKYIPLDVTLPPPKDIPINHKVLEEVQSSYKRDTKKEKHKGGRPKKKLHRVKG